MNALQQLGEQVRLFCEHHVPTEATLPVFVAGPAVLVGVGVITAVLGAKLVRPTLTLTFAIAGAVVGANVGESLGISLPLTSALTAAVFGLAGFYFLRLWVGLLTCALFAGLATGSYGAHRLMPQLETYGQTPPEVIAEQNANFTVPSIEAQQMQLNPEFKTWANQFWNDATAADQTLQRDVVVAGIAAGVFGLLLGLVAVRFTLIVVTSAIGTSLLLCGATALVHQLQPEFYRACVTHPQAAGIMGGTCLLASLVLQFLLTRSHKPRGQSKETA